MSAVRISVSFQRGACLVPLAELPLPGCRKEIQTEFVISQSNLARLETSSDEDWPEIAFAVIHLVIVHLDFRAEAEPESRELQESLAEPRRNVDQEQALMA